MSLCGGSILDRVILAPGAAHGGTRPAISMRLPSSGRDRSKAKLHLTLHLFKLSLVVLRRYRKASTVGDVCR